MKLILCYIYSGRQRKESKEPRPGPSSGYGQSSSTNPRHNNAQQSAQNKSSNNKPSPVAQAQTNSVGFRSKKPKVNYTAVVAKSRSAGKEASSTDTTAEVGVDSMDSSEEYEDSGNESSGEDVEFAMERDDGRAGNERNPDEEYPFSVLSTKDIVEHMVDSIREVSNKTIV